MAEHSAALNEAGIPGIRYLDQGSRGKDYGPAIAAQQQRIASGKPEAEAELAQLQRLQDEQLKNQTSNYVVFNPDIVDILRKYGLAGLTMGGVLAGAAQGPPAPNSNEQRSALPVAH